MNEETQKPAQKDQKQDKVNRIPDRNLSSGKSNTPRMPDQGTTKRHEDEEDDDSVNAQRRGRRDL